ncbi:putative virus X resistance protein-like, coiled-coil [Helianthus annuus]|nr:putative virus X resistance protein-like, coiled-coil [Helianthus annuus]
MGDAAVSALVKDVLGKLTSELIKEFGLIRRFKGDILRLKEDFEQIEAVLEDAEEKHIKEKAVGLWLQRLISASLKVENVLDEVSTKALLQRLNKEIDVERGILYKVRASFSKLKFRVRAAHKVKAIRTKLDEISSTRFELNLISNDTSHVDVGVEGEIRNRETSSLILDSSNILGRDEEVDMNEKEKWERLRGTLSCGAEGSIVVMTTRSEKTCRMMAKVGELQHELGCLPEEDSWLLFKKHAFAQGRVGDDVRKLEPIGREIVVKCKGLPLAVKTLGSLMWSKSSSNDWQRVKDSNIWNLQENNVEKGSKYLDGIDRCKMHDIVHDMARHVMRHDCLVIEPACNKDGIPNEVLHLSSSCPDEKLILSSKDLEKVTSLRSIFMFGEGDEGFISQLFNQVYVRVLHLALTKLRTFPESICKLKHLRYLNLSNSDIEVLPDSIMCLQNLQVLILCYYRELCKLP